MIMTTTWGDRVLDNVLGSLQSDRNVDPQPEIVFIKGQDTASVDKTER